MSRLRIARYLLWPFLLVGWMPCLAQESQEQLASHYYTAGEYAQAAEMYEALYRRAPNKFYYQMLFRSYLELE